MAVNPAAMARVRRYPFRGSPFRPYSRPKISIPGKILSLQTAWKILGALTREARAEERVAANIPAVMSGAHTDILDMI